MTALEMIQEYRKGCSNGKDCIECATALIDALEKKLTSESVTLVTVSECKKQGFLIKNGYGLLSPKGMKLINVGDEELLDIATTASFNSWYVLKREDV